MLQDHQAIGQGFRPLMENAGLKASTSLDKGHQDLYNRFSRLSGEDFDKEYLKATDKDHHANLERFKVELRITKDSDLKQVAAAQQKVLAQDTQIADDMLRNMGLSEPGLTERNAGRLVR
jgi:putative membrane protein